MFDTYTNALQYIALVINNFVAISMCHKFSKWHIFVEGRGFFIFVVHKITVVNYFQIVDAKN